MSGSWSNPSTSLIILIEQVSGFSGIFGYSPAPGAGNLVFSLTAAAGTDPYGNAYPAGMGFFRSGTLQDWIDSATGNIQIGSVTGSHFQFDVVHDVFNLFNSSATNVIKIDPGREAIFIYSGTPASGNLLTSIAGVSGTDSVGNVYEKGVTSYGSGLFTQLDAGKLVVGAIAAGVPDTADAGGLFTDTAGVITQLLGISTASGLTTNPPTFELFAGTDTEPTGSSLTPQVFLTDVAGNAAADFYLSGSVIKTNDAGSPYTWQTPTPSTGWALGSTASANYQPLRFRFTAENEVWLFGAIHATANTPTATAFVLPTAYRPIGLSGGGSTIFALGSLVSTTSADALKLVGRVNVDNNGNVTVGGFTIATSDNFYFNHVIPLGNIS